MQVSKWGNSLAVRLPKALVEALHLAPGDELSVVAASKTEIVVEKRDRRAEFLNVMEKFRWAAPEGYKFDRDEANER
jgi:antitoxin MazE